MGGDDASGADDAPFADLAREARERRLADGDGNEGGDGADDPFESMETPAVDAESVWESLAADADTAADADAEAPEFDPVPAAARDGDAGVEAVETGTATGRTAAEHVVPKRSYCQQCPHFSDPPAVACHNEGTTIVEAVDGDRFRVRDCPVARDAANVGEGEGEGEGGDGGVAPAAGE